jgi:hypothetical protein
MLGTGVPRKFSWPDSPGTAWLALDRNANWRIDDGTELFGNTRMLADGTRAANGYEVLAELDANGDGAIDSEDPAYGSLLLWEDRIRDGYSEPSELAGLATAGIKRVHLEVRRSMRTDRWGNVFRYRAKVDSDVPPHEKNSWDVFLTSQRIPTIPSTYTR